MMNRSAVAQNLAAHVSFQSWVPGWRCRFAGALICVMFLCAAVQTLHGQTKSAVRVPSEPIIGNSSIGSNQTNSAPIESFASTRRNPQTADENENDRDAVANNQDPKDEVRRGDEFKIASVDEPLSLTPFSKLALPQNRPAETAVAEFGDKPVLYSPATYFAMTSTPDMMRTFAWKAPDFYHRPLYFEEPNLERYGHHVPILQPAISGAHFFKRITSLPYCVGAYPPCEPTYTYGHYRPGSCNPHQLSRPPLSFQGLLLKGVVATGIVFTLP